MFLGAGTSPGTAFCQVPGRAQRLAAKVFLGEVRGDGAFRRRLELYTHGFMVQIPRSTICNRLHSSEQRLARWLLTVADRVGRESFPLTHEFMAQMLGVRRATVIVTAAAPARRPDRLQSGHGHDSKSPWPRARRL